MIGSRERSGPRKMRARGRRALLPARAFYALSLQSEMPALRPWLFRIAHNAALDHLKSHGRRLTEVRDDLESVAGYVAVKAALVRGRARLKMDAQADGVPRDEPVKAALDRYVSLFNARDWDGLRALVAEDCRLDLVSKSQRQGKAVGMYFSRYEKEDVRLRPVRLDGQLALAAHVGGSDRPSYFILLDVKDGRVASIRDFRYVPYIASEAEPEPA